MSRLSSHDLLANNVLYAFITWFFVHTMVPGLRCLSSQWLYPQSFCWYKGKEPSLTVVWCPSWSPLPKAGGLLWRRVPQGHCPLIFVSSLIEGPTVYPGELYYHPHPVYCQGKCGAFKSICFSIEAKYTIYSTLETMFLQTASLLLQGLLH